MAVGVPGVSSRPVTNHVGLGFMFDSGHVTNPPHQVVDCRVMEIPWRLPRVTVNNVQVNKTYSSKMNFKD